MMGRITTSILVIFPLLLCFLQFYNPHEDLRDVTQRMLKSYKLVEERSSLRQSHNSLQFASLFKRIVGEEKFNEVSSYLPPASAVESLYGKKPIIYGLDTCADYQKMDKATNIMAPAGLFNTGTNLLHSLLANNCDMQHEHATRLDAGILGEVPWGKHTPASWRNRNFPNQQFFKNINHEEVLPIVTVKDPLTWMESMCRHPYAAEWKGAKRCPRFVYGSKYRRNGFPKGHKLLRVFFNRHDSISVRYDTILDLWNVHTQEWMDASFPRVIIRYEDLLFRTEEVVKQVCECGGGKLREGEFQFATESAKHQGSGLLAALIKYGNETLRDEILSDEKDLDFVRGEISERLVNAFGYKMP